MAHQTHYEVHVKHGGRWEIHARHEASEKESAIEEAKALYALKHIQSVKVIQEIFDPDEGLSKEYNVYTPDQARQPPRKNGARSPAKKAGKNAARDGDPVRRELKESKAKPKTPISVILLRMSGIISFSIIVGSMFTWFTSMVLSDSSIGENAQANILFIVFLVVFVISAIPMAMVFLNNEK